MQRIHSRLTSAACILALLCMQFAALSHSVWHAGKRSTVLANVVAVGQAAIQRPGQREGKTRPLQEELCAFDVTLAQSLGAVPMVAGLPLQNAAAYPPIVSRFHPRFSIEAPVAQSRGPPVFS
jgi:hypothetical protein